MGTIVGWITITDDELSKLKSGDFLHNLELPSMIRYDIDKSWDIIHFLLTGSKIPTDQMIGEIIYAKDYIEYLSQEEYEKYRTCPNEISSKVREELNEKIEQSISYINKIRIPFIIEELNNINFGKRLKEITLEELVKRDIYLSKRCRDIDNLKEYVLIKYEGLIIFLNKVAQKKSHLVVQMES